MTTSLLSRLPTVRGRYTENTPLAPTSWFGVGGPAEVLFKPKDKEDLADFLKACPIDIPVTIIGVASNLIIRDGGVDGVVIRLGREFAFMEVDTTDPTHMHIGAAALDINTAIFSAQQSVAGLEFLSGIPGTIGGALRMNAGAYGREMVDILINATAIDRQGNTHTLTPDEIGMHYRHTDAPEDWIWVECTLQGTVGNKEAILAAIEDIKQKREESQPIREKTGGSTFANPERDIPGTGSAWQAVDKAGCRGLTLGGAQISQKHCNFMINTGHATAEDLENLGDEVRRRVKEKLNINLRWEIKRIGKKKEK